MYLILHVQLLQDSQRYIQQIQAFQGSCVNKIYSERSPLARILTTVYGVRYFIIYINSYVLLHNYVYM